jgi:DNA end-binding protein Ku
MKKEKSRSHGGIWNGAISFGLVNIPVSLVSSKEKEPLHFTMLDPSNMSPVGYRYYNKQTGRDIDRAKTVKAYKYKNKDYVLLSEADFAKANPKATQTLDIENFVTLESIDPVYFDRSYYLMPQKNALKGYVLLRDVLLKEKKAAIAKIVLHNKQHLAALVGRGRFLTLELLHFADEVKDMTELRDLERELPHVKLSQGELRMAQSLVDDMTEKWEPASYEDTYRDDLMKQIERKFKSGKAKQVSRGKVHAPKEKANVIDLMPLLKKSLKEGRSHRKPTKSHHA